MVYTIGCGSSKYSSSFFYVSGKIVFLIFINFTQSDKDMYSLFFFTVTDPYVVLEQGELWQFSLLKPVTVAL